MTSAIKHASDILTPAAHPITTIGAKRTIATAAPHPARVLPTTAKPGTSATIEEALTPLERITVLRNEMWLNGFRPIAVSNWDSDPTRSPSKRPIGFGWQLRARRTPPEAAVTPALSDGQNTGVLCDGLRAVDIDFDDVEISGQLTALTYRMFGKTVIRTRRNSGKVLLLYRAAEGEPRKRALIAEHGKVEILGHGQQLVAFGRHHSGATLDWPDGSPAVVRRVDLPAVTESQVTEYLEACRLIVGSDATVQASEDARRSTYGFTADMVDIAAAMQVISNDGPADWNAFNRIGMALWAATEGSNQGFDLFNAWAEQSTFYDPDAVSERWAIYPSSPPDRIGAGTLFYLAKEHDPAWRRPSAAVTEGAEFDKLPPLPPESVFQRGNRHFRLNQDGAALAFVAEHANNLRYCHQFGCWLKWTGSIWKHDHTDLAFEWARELSREMADNAVRKEFAKVAHAAAVERFARSDRELVVEADALDRDHMLLGTPGGTVNLHTGELLPARPDDLITESTAVAPTEKADCPRWLQFLEESTGGDTDLIGFLQRFGGYMLTGMTNEHALLFVHGAGGNGKSVWLNTLTGIMGTYAKTAAMDSLTASRSERHPTDMAMLHGARLVSASETEEGRAWAESKIKALTGGDPVTARFMRENFFTYTPRFKLIVVGNHKPALRNPDEAAKRRFNIVPFIHKPETPDRQLEGKLRKEWPSILRWLINGCLDWQQHGLLRPQVVTDATAEYFSEQDSVGLWLEQFCDIGGRGLHASTDSLFKSWSSYALNIGEKPNTQKWLADTLGPVENQGIPTTTASVIQAPKGVLRWTGSA